MLGTKSKHAFGLHSVFKPLVEYAPRFHRLDATKSRNETPSALEFGAASGGNPMIGKAMALIQVPNQRLFGPAAAAKYLGICTDTLYKITDLGQLAAFDFNGRRAYRLEDMDKFVESLRKWDDGAGEKPESVHSLKGA